MPEGAQPVPAQGANYALNELRRIITASAAAGLRKLPTERELTGQLGITRHALRQALDVLETEGLLWRRQGAGTFIGSPQGNLDSQINATLPGTTFEEAIETRLRLEPQLAQLAAIRATAEDLDRMRELNRRSIEASDPESCELWDGAFHRQIALAARNRILLSLFDVTNRVREEPFWQMTRDTARATPGSSERINQSHLAIIAAIEARDPRRAGQMMCEHLLDVQARWLRRMSGDSLFLHQGQGVHANDPDQFNPREI